MSALILTILVIIMLIAAYSYFCSIGTLELIQQKTESDKSAKKFLVIPIFFTVINLFLIKVSSSPELMIAILLLWLNITFFFLLLIKYYCSSKAIILASVLSQALIFVIYLTGLEILNNILLILAYIAAVTLVFKRLKINDLTWISLLVIMAVLDTVFVWLVPAVPVMEAQIQPLLFSLLVKIGNISLGAGDMVFLLLAILLLAKRFTYKIIFGQAVILSLSIFATLSIQHFLPSSATSFPFLVVLAPIFLLLYFITSIFLPNKLIIK